jgi:general secretion pathway protein F
MQVRLDDLIALSDEVAALVRAGVPLDQGLRMLARDLPTRLGRLAERLGERLESGDALAAALESTADFPPAYRAVAVAGLKSGRLASALEGIATTARRVAEARRMTAVAMIYPLITLVVASVLFAFSVLHTTPVVLDALQAFDVDLPGWFPWAIAAARSMMWLLPGLWLLLLGCLLIGYLGAGRSAVLGGSRLGRAPAIARLRMESQLATFHEVLALLIDQQVPLDEAVALSADTVGSGQLRAGAHELSARLRGGERGTPLVAGVPALLTWLLMSNTPSAQLVGALRRAAAAHRRRVDELAAWVGVYLPIAVSAGVGGVLTLCYVLLVMGPFYYLMHGLTR